MSALPVPPEPTPQESALRDWQATLVRSEAAILVALADPELTRAGRLEAVQDALWDLSGASSRLTEVTARAPYVPGKAHRGERAG
jgi:hypothetical protein